MSAGPQHLPPPVDPMGSRLQCSALPLDVFSKTTENAIGVKSKVLQEAGRVSALAQNTPQTLRKRRPAEAFLLSEKQDQEPKPVVPVVVSPSGGEIFSPPLISIGPSSDAVLDHLKMEDQTLLRLHLLLGTVRSSRWESVLASQEWGLRPDQASTLATALLKDVQGSRDYTITVAKVRVLSVYQELVDPFDNRNLLSLELFSKGWAFWHWRLC